MTDQLDESSKNLFFVRSPIFNRDLKVSACELFFSTEIDGAVTKENVTMKDIVHAFEKVALTEIVGSETTFLSIPEELSGIEPPIKKQQMRLEISMQDNVSQSPLSTIRRLARDGYSTVVTDFDCQGDDWKSMAKLADVIKINVDNKDETTLQGIVEQLSDYKAQLCATQVNSYEKFKICEEKGFHYFQGVFLSRPWRDSVDEVPVGRLAVLQLLCGLLNPEITPDEIVDLLSRDARLSYKLLAILNSATFTLPREIDSLVEAVVMLGLKQLRSWAGLIALSTVDDKPHELMVTAMVRAKMCEILALKTEQPDPDMYFTVGLFSVLDAILDRPMEAVLEKLPLSEYLNQALLSHEGMLGMVLHNVKAYENAEFEQLNLTDVDINDYRQAYLDSMCWTKEILKTLESA